MAELSSVDYAFLAVLRTIGREVSNTELDRMYEVRLVGRPFERLVGAGYISSDTKHRPYRHVITQDGLKALAADLGIGDDHVEDGEKRSLREKILWAGLVAAHQRPAGAGPAEAARAQPDDLDGRIRTAYANLVSTHGQWVSLHALRAQLADVDRAALDRTLRQMLRSGDVRLEPDPLEHRVSAEERAAAIHVGGEYRHKLAIGRP